MYEMIGAGDTVVKVKVVVVTIHVLYLAGACAEHVSDLVTEHESNRHRSGHLQVVVVYEMKMAGTRDP